MKKLIFLLLLGFSLNVFSEAFKINGEILSFKKHPSGLLIKNCEKNCEALKVLSLAKYDPKKIKKTSSLASSYGSTACHNLLGGVSLLGMSLENDGRDFCVFKDKSIVEINSLTIYLKENKVKNNTN